MYAQVAVIVPRVQGVYDYHLPEELEGHIQPGCLVVVPFGRQTVQGIVMALVEEPQVKETKAVKALLDAEPVMTQAQMALARWIADETLSPLASCLELMFPPGLSQQADTLFHLHQNPSENSTFSMQQRRIISLLQRRGDLRGRQLDSAFPHQDWRRSMRGLIHQEWVTTRPVLPPPRVHPKYIRNVRLACMPEEAEKVMDKLGRGAALDRRKAILRYLLQQHEPVPVSWVYASSGGNAQDLKRLAKMGLVVLGEDETWRDPLEEMDLVPLEPPILTSEQEKVWEKVRAGYDETLVGIRIPPYLLYGVTSSGKTEIYLRAVDRVLQSGRQAIILLPEIAITPQTVRRFATRFPGQVGLVHSRLSDGERYDTWRRARAGLLKIIVGPRSALFTTLPDLGLIVIDEFHEETYAQSDLQPHYHAVRAAIAYAAMVHGMLLLGSATPDIAIMYQAKREGWPILRLPARIMAHCKTVEAQLEKIGRKGMDLPITGSAASLPLPPVRIVDMREELKGGNRSIFSRRLQEGLSNVLENQQQAILFLNRRGSATYVFCRQCGYSLKCPRCDLPLTYHAGSAALLCHICNYRRQMPRTCPECGSNQIRHYGSGTEKVEIEVLKQFPHARTLRWDADTTRSKGSHDIILTHFVRHQADILIGTQMLAKGLDLSLVTLVGVVLADVGLNFPDYRTGERLFHLLTQVAGRAGRSPLGGEVVLQTFQPDHYVIQAAAEHNFDAFYATELENRLKLKYPPYYRLARLEFRHKDSRMAQEKASEMARRLTEWIEEGGHKSSELIGPAPCYFSRIGGEHRWQIILRSPDPLAILRRCPLDGWDIEIDPMSLL